MVTDSISTHFGTSFIGPYKSILPYQSLLHTLLFINLLIQGFIRETVLHSSLRYWSVEICVLLKKFVIVERGYGEFLFTNKSCLTFPTRLIFPSKAGTERSCWRAQVIAISLSLESLFCCFSIFSVSTQACTQYCLQIRHLGDEWNLLAKSCDVLDFLRSEQLLQLPFHSLVLRTIFSVFAIFSHSPTLPSPPCLSGYHLQFNAYLGWALTIASTMKWPRPCLHA